MAYREWTVKAERGSALTAAELISTLELAPPGSQPKVVINWGGTIKQITIQSSREEEK